MTMPIIHVRCIGNLARRSIVNVMSRRFQSLGPNPQEVYTRISDTKDPKRDKFFQYSWGSWLKDNERQRAKRTTRFSIEGATKLIADLAKEKSDGTVKNPTSKNGSSILSHNILLKTIGNDSNVTINSISSIHEGKHHRVYKILLSSDKHLVLRLPYRLESDVAILQKIKSEVATMDFLDLKLKLNVPKVLAYGPDRSNALEHPFILMEYVEGDLLMKQWEPMAKDEEKVKSVITPIADFHLKVISVEFNKFGSLYFDKDVASEHRLDAAYEGEEDESLSGRWRIGPSVERPFSKRKNKLPAKTVAQHNGPWKADEPLQLISSVTEVELENLKNRLALAQADAGSDLEDQENLKKQITTFEHLKVIGPKLLNPKSKSIMNVEELFKPRLYVPDLDPMNVIINVNRDNEPYFLDFEYSTIKPFILSNYPPFVAYHGAKVYDLENDIPGYADMDEVEKQQYEFMFYKTRNERIWENDLNTRRHDLIAVASPHIKVLRSPYTQVLEYRNDEDYLYVEACIVQLQAMWEAYVANELCNSSETKFPIEYSKEYLDEYTQALNQYQADVVSTPFAATDGWIPQDMFDQLVEQGILVEENGEYKVATEKVLKPEEGDTH